MPQSKNHAGERSIGDIFTDEYRFTIPRYQRPYAWMEEQAGEMFDEVSGVMPAFLAMEEIAAHCDGYRS